MSTSTQQSIYDSGTIKGENAEGGQNIKTFTVDESLLEMAAKTRL